MFVALPRHFRDTGRVQDLESRLLTCMETLQGFDAAEIARTPFGKGEQANLTALATWIAAESRGMRFAPCRRSIPRSGACTPSGSGPSSIAAARMTSPCASCHGEEGKRIRLQDLPQLTRNPGDGVGFAAWPAYRVNNGQMWSSATAPERLLSPAALLLRLRLGPDDRAVHLHGRQCQGCESGGSAIKR